MRRTAAGTAPSPTRSTQWAANRWQKSHLHLRKPRCWAAWDGTWTGHTDAKLLGRAGEWSRTAVSSQLMAIKRAPVQIDRELSTLEWRYNNPSGMNSEDRKRQGTIPGRNKLDRPHLPPIPWSPPPHYALIPLRAHPALGMVRTETSTLLQTSPSCSPSPLSLTPLFPPLCLLRRCSVIAAVPDLWEFLKRICGRSVGRAEELSQSFLALLPLLLREAFPNVLLPTRRAKSTSTPETSTGACVQCETLMEFKVQFFCLLLKALW
ncbi:hypothetical protein CMEL01_14864 [Colletotrichum melonis]|uniref:Uncharacterized protein n=1 Tax=Colletotrichum melonis TaxID=1209925 RepID=A0AAI9UQE3_9PEZI|nr:hypothetical protein CMEL01_14864 [Colletotrichum melonis]